MVQRSLGFTLKYLIVLWVIALPASGISISCSYGEGKGFVSSSERFDLDQSTSMQNCIAIGSGGISQAFRRAGLGLTKWLNPYQVVDILCKMRSTARAL